MRKAAENRMHMIPELAEKILKSDRRSLSRAITLVESSRADHQEQAAALIAEVSKHKRQALRIGLSGTPGVGKSTFIESFGMQLIAQGLRVAVLAVDPSSARSGGSILGDKTRMDYLSREPNAFIRPSPSQSHLGGVARRTREAVALCEAANFDVVLIETVGVGQSETIVAEMSDLFILLLAPAGGDELQGVKRGIMEMADIILVNKADGDLKSAATRTCADYAGALRLLRKRPQDPEGYPLAMTVSAATQDGLDEAWQKMQALSDWRKAVGKFDAIRESQARFWFQEDLKQGLLSVLKRDDVAALSDEIAHQVAQGDLSPAQAAQAVMRYIQGQ